MTTIRDSIYDSLPVLDAWYTEHPTPIAAPKKTKPFNNKRVSFRVDPSIISAKSYSLLVDQDIRDYDDDDAVSPSLCCHLKCKHSNFHNLYLTIFLASQIEKP